MRRFPIIILLALVVLRIPALLHPVLDVDEAIYGLFARIWFDGGMPYLDCVETKPLGIYFFYGLIFSVFGKWNMLAVHAVTILIVGATAYVIYLIANICHSRGSKRESPARTCIREIPDYYLGDDNLHGDDRVGYWAAFLYVIFTTTYIPKVIATTVEPVMLLPICLQFYWWLKYEGSGRGRFAFLSGLAFATACCFKYQAGIDLFVLLIYLIVRRPYYSSESASGGRVENENARFSTSSKTISLTIFIVGALIPPAIMLAYLYFRGALADFWFWNIGGNLQYIGEGSSALKIGHQILTRALPFVASTGLVWVMAVVCSVRVVAGLCPRQIRATTPARQRVNGGEGRPYSPKEWLILLWLLLTIIPVSTGYRFYGHYFLLLMPPLAILAAPVASNIWAGDKKWLKGLVAFWIIVPALGFFIARFYMADIHRSVGEDNLDNYKPLAAYVAARTKPDDRIIAWGYAPLIYWDAERLPATRFFWSDLLTGRVSGTKGKQSAAVADKTDTIFWDMFMNDLEHHKPAYIIDTTPANLHDYKAFPVIRYPRLMEFIDGNYREEAVINGVVFYRRGG